MNKVIIFRDSLLPRSETFIQGQAEALRGFAPVFAGLRPSHPTLPVKPAVYMTTATGRRAKAAALAYRLTSIAPRFHRALDAQNASLIHAHFAVDGAAALRMRRILSLPLVVTLHGYDVTWEDSAFEGTLAGRRYLQQRTQLFEEASLFLCVSESIRSKATMRGFPASKLVVHYTGIDTSTFAPLPKGRAEQSRVILFVGRLVEMKGCEYLLRAAALLRSSGVSLVIIGDGSLRGELERLASELALDVSFLGAQPAEIVRMWLAKARIFCVPSVTTSLGQAEGLGMVFLEAQGMGIPVVSSRSGGIPEAVADGETGLLAPERDAAALAAHLKRFLEDNDFWDDCSRRGPARVAAQFDIHQQTARLERHYEALSARN